MQEEFIYLRISILETVKLWLKITDVIVCTLLSYNAVALIIIYGVQQTPRLQIYV